METRGSIPPKIEKMTKQPPQLRIGILDFLKTMFRMMMMPNKR